MNGPRPILSAGMHDVLDVAIQQTVHNHLAAMVAAGQHHDAHAEWAARRAGYTLLAHVSEDGATRSIHEMPQRAASALAAAHPDTTIILTTWPAP